MFRITALRAGVFAAVALLATTVFLTTYGRQQTSSQTVSDNVEVELVTLRPAGFEPAEITRPKGPFVLMVDDRTGLEKLALTLKKQDGGEVRHLKTDRRKTEWTGLLDLAPGDYLLVATEHAEWTFRVMVHP